MFVKSIYKAYTYIYIYQYGSCSILTLVGFIIKKSQSQSYKLSRCDAKKLEAIKSVAKLP